MDYNKCSYNGYKGLLDLNDDSIRLFINKKVYSFMNITVIVELDRQHKFNEAYLDLMCHEVVKYQM